MFNLREFIKNTIEKMIGKEAEYKIRQYAVAWYDKGVLLIEDLEELESKLNPQEVIMEQTEV